MLGRAAMIVVHQLFRCTYLGEGCKGLLQVLEMDATQEPDLASSWGVLSVPTTFLIDSRGKLRHVNHGVASAEKLLTQLYDAPDSP